MPAERGDPAPCAVCERPTDTRAEPKIALVAIAAFVGRLADAVKRATSEPAAAKRPALSPKEKAIGLRAIGGRL